MILSVFSTHPVPHIPKDLDELLAGTFTDIPLFSATGQFGAGNFGKAIECCSRAGASLARLGLEFRVHPKLSRELSRSGFEMFD